jgi:hypothetical protein
LAVKKQGQVVQSHSNQYAGWRSRSGLLSSLHEETDGPPERLLQAIWFHQRLHRDRFRTIAGLPVQVLHPGFWNREAGPDFRNAVVQFGAESPRIGDIEIDLRGSDWHAHHHDVNPDFRNVVLHVVWDGQDSRDQPTLALKPVLDSPLSDLSIWLGSESARSFPPELLGQCCAPLRGLPSGRLIELLHQAAFVRLQAKAAHLQARARQAGWEQALWEGLFRALGYKQNLWPMQRLAELRLRLCPEGRQTDVLSMQARLLGAGGLLPDDLTRVQARGDNQLRRLWDCWWREREDFQDYLLPRGLWRFSGQRPANHPQRRLALASHWLVEASLPGRLEKWCARSMGSSEQSRLLLAALQVPKDEFWSRHWTLRSKSFEPPQPLIGATRVADLAMNVVLPWLWVRALEGKNRRLQEEMERRYFSWPSAEDNSVLRLARERLLGGASARMIPGAAGQQGLLQIVRDFCEHSNALCAECRFPELVREFPS